jgi:hypothetical protein
MDTIIQAIAYESQTGGQHFAFTSPMHANPCYPDLPQ